MRRYAFAFDVIDPFQGKDQRKMYRRHHTVLCRVAYDKSALKGFLNRHSNVSKIQMAQILFIGDTTLLTSLYKRFKDLS